VIGAKKHVAVRCDDGDGGHSWDIVRNDRCVAQCVGTRKEAREEARKLDAEESAKGAK